MERPQSLQKFIQNSGVQIQRSSPPAFPRRLQNSIINNQNMGEFAQFLNSNNNNNVPVSRLSISGLNPGMFNATVNKDFNAEARIDLKRILQNPPLGKTSIGEGLFIETKELVGVYGRFKTGFSHTREYGKKGNINEKFFTVQIKFTLTNGTETNGGTVNFYKNGKIRFSGGFIGKNIDNQPELIRKFMVKKYTQGQPFLYNPFSYNNLSGQFRINGVIKSLAGLASRGFRYGFSDITYDPELSPMMYITYKEHKYIIASSGAIQISGARDPRDLKRAYDTALDLFNMLHAKGEITLTANVPRNVSRKTTTVRKQTSSCPKTRRPPCKPGFQAKKNPQGDECCYKIPKKTSKRKSPVNDLKISYDNDGTMRVGKKKCQMLTKTTLLTMAKKLGVVGMKDSNKKEKLCGMIKNFNLGNTSYKVGQKPCVTYKKDELVAMALDRGISVTDSDTIKTLCEKMKLDENKKKQNERAQNKMMKNLNRALKNEAKNAEVEKRRRLNKNSVKNDILKLYGTRWVKKYKNVMNIEKDVKDMTKLLNNASNESNVTNKRGILKKTFANSLKKEQVSEWKAEREKAYNEKLIRKEYGKHGNAVVNYIMTHNPTKAQIKKYIEKYKKIRANLTKNK